MVGKLSWQERLKAAKQALQLSMNPHTPPAAKLKLGRAATNLMKLAEALRQHSHQNSRKFLVLPENSSVPNEAALEWVKEAKEAPDPHLPRTGIARLSRRPHSRSWR